MVKELTVKKDHRPNKSEDLNTQPRARQNSGFISEDNAICVKNRPSDYEIPLFQLREIEGDMINPEIIRLGAHGIIGGLRNSHDGIAYFGYSKTNSLNKVINDFVLRNTKGITSKTDHVFQIWFNQGISSLINREKTIYAKERFIR